MVELLQVVFVEKLKNLKHTAVLQLAWIIDFTAITDHFMILRQILHQQAESDQFNVVYHFFTQIQ